MRRQLCPPSLLIGACVLHSTDFPSAERQLTQFDWALYSFNNGYLVSSICSCNLPLKIVLASNLYTHSRALCHTVVLDKDSKFFGVCRKSPDFLQINCHVLPGDNHNPMVVECICRYLNSGLKIMVNEHDSVHIALKAILLLLYAWNSCLVPGTDTSHSMVAVSCEFTFPIDYSAEKHWDLTSSPTTTIAMVSSISQLVKHPLPKPVLNISIHPNHSKYQTHISQLVITKTSIGQPYLNSMMRSTPSHGRMLRKGILF